ncbi:hypothetical protein JCM16303_004701 [Sporobolomyces ruberrimus]
MFRSVAAPNERIAGLGRREPTSDDSTRCQFSSSSSHSSPSATTTETTTDNIEVRDTSKWPTGGFEPSWMEPTTSDEESDLEFNRMLASSVNAQTTLEGVGPPQEFEPIERRPLEPLLPQRFNSPSTFLDSGRSGYRVKSLALGSLDESFFRGFNVEREIDIENGRLALIGERGGGIDISGYGFEYSSAFHIKFVAGSVQTMYIVRPRSDGLIVEELEEVTIIVSTLQTPVFRASISARADYYATSQPRVSALDEDHSRIVPYLSRHFLVRLSFSPEDSFNPLETLPATFPNLVFDLERLETIPSPTYIDSSTFSINEGPSSYSSEILKELSTELGEFDSPALTFPLSWILYDSTLTPREILVLIEEHVRAWEATVGYDEEVVEDILYELRTTLVEKRQRRYERFKRGESLGEGDGEAMEFRFEGVEEEAELARQRVVERRKLEEGGGVGNDLLDGRIGRDGKKYRRGQRKGRVSLEERGKRNVHFSRGVVVTLSGSIKIQGKGIEKTNSIIRSHWDGVDHFLRVAFKEEDGLVLSTVGGIDAGVQHELLDGTITRILKNGLILGGRKFELLSYSQASLRDGAAVFIAPFSSWVVRAGLGELRLINASLVRLSMGHFDKVSHQPAMLGARWSQGFTTTSASVVMKDQQIHRISDILEYNEQGEEITCHTDGAGLLSPKLRDSICETLIKNGYKLSSEAPFPSVFQFRLGGYKGILAVDNTQEGIGIAVRPSQEKFLGLADTDEGDSFVLNIAEAFDKPRPLRLRTSKQLLKSFAQLEGLPPSLLHDEPFLRQALGVVRIRILRSFKYHASIPLPDCYLLVGVPDEDGILEEDEVYIALRDARAPETVTYLEGPIAITRSPTIDAGDVRLVKAIGKCRGQSRLNSLENCVVLPTKGERTLSSMMGGGDLDGDCYQTITLPELIPKKMFPPASHQARPPLTFERPATIDDVADCFVHYLENNFVGPIATKHLIVSDKSREHGRDPIAIKLADLHRRYEDGSHAVDSPKTGQVVLDDDLPRLPDYLKRERPDFLQGEQRDYARNTGYYPSTRALGQLFRDIDFDEVEVPEEVDWRTASGTGHELRDFVSSAFTTLRSIVDARVAAFLDTSLGSLNFDSHERRKTALELRTSFCSHLKDLATVHSFPRTGGRRLSEVEVFAVTNLATSTRDTVARGNAVVAMGTQLESIVEWLKKQFGSGEEGIRKMRAAWVIGLEREGEREEDWDYGVRAFGWITLSILLENVLLLEGLKREGRWLRHEPASLAI